MNINSPTAYTNVHTSLDQPSVPDSYKFIPPFQARREYLQKKDEAVQKKEQVFRDAGLADTDQELFGTEEVLSDDSQTKTDQPFTGQQPGHCLWHVGVLHIILFAADSLFDESEGKGNAAMKKSAKISVLKEHREEALFLPGGGGKGGEENGSQRPPIEIEDNSELLK